MEVVVYTGRIYAPGQEPQMYRVYRVGKGLFQTHLPGSKRHTILGDAIEELCPKYRRFTILKRESFSWRPSR